MSELTDVGAGYENNGGPDPRAHADTNVHRRWAKTPGNHCGWCVGGYKHIAASLAAEAEVAAAKHTPMHSHHEAKAVIEEEFDEYWDLVKLNPRKPMTHPTKGHAMTPDQWRQELRDELVQMGAMCVRALHDLCAVRSSENESFDQTAIARDETPSVKLRTDIKNICGSTRPETGDCVRPAGHPGSHRGYNGNLWEAR